MITSPKNSEFEKYSCDSVYLRSAVENKIGLILFENERINELSFALNDFEKKLVEMINGYVQTMGRNVFNQMDKNNRKNFINTMKAITTELQEWLIGNEIEVTVQTYEYVMDGQMWLLRDYVECLPRKCRRHSKRGPKSAV